jgi:hypothetical protein
LGGLALAVLGRLGLDPPLGGAVAILCPATLFGSGDLLLDLVEGAEGSVCPAIDLGGAAFLPLLGRLGAEGAFALLIGSEGAPESDGTEGAPLAEGRLGIAGWPVGAEGSPAAGAPSVWTVGTPGAAPLVPPWTDTALPLTPALTPMPPAPTDTPKALALPAMLKARSADAAHPRSLVIDRI